MSQVLLGVRNLSFRIAVFVALAAALVWFLGGSLLPKPTRILHGEVEVGRAGEGLGRVRLVQVIHPIESLPSERQTWHVESDASGDWSACEKQAVWTEVTPLVAVRDGTGFGVAWFSARSAGGDAWTVHSIGGYEACPNTHGSFADRLEAERQIARVVAGLPVQTAEQARAARDAVLRAGE
ncbi:MAG: hypothetical protein ACOYMM_04295 [Phycisphaerales bacterium]